MRMLVGRIVTVVAAGSLLVAGGAFRSADAAGSTAEVWATNAGVKLARIATPTVGAGAASGKSVLKIYPTRVQQSMGGFGASITGASAANIASLPQDTQTQLMRDLFDPVAGIGLDQLRQPMASTDFGRDGAFYSYDDSPTPDPSLSQFSIQRDETEQILPLVRAARSLNPAMQVMATPWSAPAWMKTSNDLRGGSLKPEFEAAFADYFVKFLQAYAAAGVPVQSITPLNEPLFPNSQYPSMYMSPEQQAKFLQVLDAKLTAAGLNTEIFVYDHNWDDATYAKTVLDLTSSIPRVVGAAFHCYATNKGAIAAVHALGKRVIMSECSGTVSAFTDSLLWQFQNLVIGATREGSESTTMWNVALDANGGPHQGYCENRCNGLIEVANGTYTKKADFYVLGHAAKFLSRGAKRIDSTTGPLPNVAFLNPDGTRVVLVANANSTTKTMTLTDGTSSIRADIPGRTIATITW